MSEVEVREFLRGLVVRIVDALESTDDAALWAQQIGTEMVGAHIAAPEALGASLKTLDSKLLSAIGVNPTPRTQARFRHLLAELATGYARALRDRTLDAQDQLRRAALVARNDAELALRASEARYRHLALHDPLTDLPNRTMFMASLSSALTRSAGSDDVGVCFLDLDEFKAINDRLGHTIADELLVVIAERLRAVVSSRGYMLARLGGDEFMLLAAPSPGVDELVALAAALLDTIAQPARVGEHELRITASIGIVVQPADSTDATSLVRAADTTLYWAKSDGKRRWAIFDPDRQARDLQRYSLAAAMPAGLGRGEFIVDYQPIISLTDGTLRGAEALVRWNHPQFGLLNPDRFIPLAEGNGFIVPLGAHVVAEACEQARRWEADGFPPPYVSVNLSAIQAHHPDLVDTVADALSSAALPPYRLVLEVTERTIMTPTGEPFDALTELVDLGVRVSIDDFGTGYSNLSYLRTLPVHELKLDASFVSDLDSDLDADRGARLAASVIDMAHALDLGVTAEGIETIPQALRLRDLGCDSGQGWLFGYPGPSSDLLTVEDSPRRIAGLLGSW